MSRLTITVSDEIHQALKETLHELVKPLAELLKKDYICKGLNR